MALFACSDAPTAEPRTRLVPAIPFTGLVVDAADLLDSKQEANLTRKLQAFQAATGHQLVVATTPTLNGEDIAPYSLRLANSWGVGHVERDDGVVLLLAPKEHQVRIEVGTGLEKTLTNARCAEILARDVMPRLRAGDIPGGIDAGATALISQLQRS